MEHPDVFVMALVGVGGRDHGGVNRCERSPIGKSIYVGVHGIGHGDVVEGNVVRKDDHEIHLGGGGSGADAGESFLPVLR